MRTLTLTLLLALTPPAAFALRFPGGAIPAYDWMAYLGVAIWIVMIVYGIGYVIYRAYRVHTAPDLPSVRWEKERKRLEKESHQLQPPAAFHNRFDKRRSQRQLQFNQESEQAMGGETSEAVELRACACGCGEQTRETWAPGHDSRHFWKVVKARGWDTESLLALVEAVPPRHGGGR